MKKTCQSIKSALARSHLSCGRFSFILRPHRDAPGSPEGPGTGEGGAGLSCAPACTCVGVAALPNPAAVVEVELEGFAG